MIARLLILLCIASVSACGGLAKHDEDVFSVAEQILGEQTDANGSPKKVELPVHVNYTIKDKPLANHKLDINFEFIAREALPMLRIGIKTTNGLKLKSSDDRIRYKDVSAQQLLRHKIAVIPLEEEQYYVDVYVVTEIGEDKRARLIQIPISLGKYALQRHPKIPQ